VPDELQTWFASRVPKDWFTGGLEIMSDGEEILVVGNLPDVELAGGTSAAARAAAQDARIDRFREETRDDRVRIAREGERHFRRKVGWGARCGDQMKLFTTASVPVMTRLRMPERSILDTLVGMHQKDWIKGLRDALVKVDEARGKGPLN